MPLIESDLIVGVDDLGHDVKFFGATSGRYLLWDESDDALEGTDDVRIKLGASSDLQIVHSSASYIHNTTNTDLYFKQSGVDKDIIFLADDGSGSETAYLTLDGSAGYSVASKQIRFNDSVSALFGSSEDMGIYHNGTNSYIENATGNLEIINGQNDGDIIFKSDDGSGGTETYFFLDGSANVDGNPRTKFPDNSRLMFGAGDDMDIFHNGTNSFIRNNSTSGDLIIQQSGADKDIIFNCDDGSGGETAYITLDGSNTDVDFNKNAHFLDHVTIKIGRASGGDLQFYHNASHSLISNPTVE